MNEPAASGDARLRPLLFSIAYEMLGSVGDAEDLVQEAYLRIHRARREGETIRSPRAYLTTVVTRLAIDELRSARVQRESYTGPWLPEPVVQENPDQEPAARAELADTLSLSFLVVLEELGPIERAVFLLRDVFDYRYREIAEIVGRTEVNCRQIHSRARRHVDAGLPRTDTDAARRDVARRLVIALHEGEVDRVLELLAPEVVFTGDGGGKAAGLREPLYGREPVGRFLSAIAAARRNIGGAFSPATINGRPGTVNLDGDGQLVNVFAFEIAGGQVTAIQSVINPDKLGHLGYPLSPIGRRRSPAD